MEGPENCLQMRALASSASASGSMEMDAQRLARLKQEEKEKQKKESEETTGQEEIGEEAAAMAAAMAIEDTIREKAYQMLSIVGKAKAGMAVKVRHVSMRSCHEVYRRARQLQLRYVHPKLACRQ